jgi:acyl-coenzyme A thioesterase 9
MVRSETLDGNMTLSGSVIYTGSSSMEVCMSAHCDGFTAPFVVASFTFVARDTRNSTAWKVNPLCPETPEETLLFSAAAKRVAVRKANAKGATGKAEQLDADSKQLHLWLSEAQSLTKLPCLTFAHSFDHPVLLQSTRLSNSMICQPQQRNTAGRVFGGFLMRRAFELAFATAYTFCGRLPTLAEVDEVVFRQPVEVGNLLQLDSCVLFTTSNRGPHNSVAQPGQQAVYVEVVAYVTAPESRSCKISNTFHFTLVVDSKSVLPRVVPNTSDDARRMLARWRFHP